MKKLLILFSFILIFCNLALATPPAMTNVSATLTDTTTQVWTNGTWQATFQNPFGNPNQPKNNGNPVIQQYSGAIDGSGHFTVSLDDNNVVTPTGSHWVFTLCPNATVPVCSNATVLVTGVSQDLSATLSAALTIPIVNTKPTIFRAYNDTEAFGGLGALYIRTNDNTFRLCADPLGCPGSGWSSAGIDPNNPVFTGTVTADNIHVLNNLNVDGTTTLNNLTVTGITSVGQCIDFIITPFTNHTQLCKSGTGANNVNIPSVDGTMVVTATSPLSIDVNGNITCAGCGSTSFPLLAPNGSDGAPSYSFSGETAAGMWRPTTDTISIDSGTPNLHLVLDNSHLVLLGFNTLCWAATGLPSPTCGMSITRSGDNVTMTDNSSSGNGVFIADMLKSGIVRQTGAFGNGVNTDYWLNGLVQSSTPTSPGSGEMIARFVAGKGLCATDNSGVEYCTSQNAGNIQEIRTTSTCTTGNSSFDTCDTTLTWPVTFTDTNYSVTCSGVGPVDGSNPTTGRVNLQIASYTATQVTARTVTLGASAVSWTAIDCIGKHD